MPRSSHIRPVGLAVAVCAIAAARLSSADEVSLHPGFTPDPMVLAGTAGGTTHGTRHGMTATGPCTGWIASEPGHLIALADRFAFLRFSVVAPSDTTLIISGPDGPRCSDDSDGFNPAIAGDFPAGEYRVWVGAYSSGESVRYSLSISSTR